MRDLVLTLNFSGQEQVNMGDVFFRKPRTLQEYEIVAQRLLPPQYFKYYTHPGPSGQTYKDSPEAFKRYVYSMSNGFDLRGWFELEGRRKRIWI